MTRTRVLGLFRLFRFELPFSAGMCVILGELLALGKLPAAADMALGFLSFFFISATALILNDYFDLEIDKINAPERPLPSGLVSKRDVVLLSSVVALLGFVTSYMISMTALFVVFLVWVVGILYNWRVKWTGFLGNLLVSFSVGMAFIFGGIAVGNPYEKVVWWFGAIAMFIDLGEEIAADAIDIQGDQQAGSRSLAIVLGLEKALKISGMIFLFVIVISSLPFILGWLGWIYLLPISIMDGVILFSTVQLLNPQSAERRRYIRWIYLSGLVAILIFIFIRIVD